MIFFLCNIPSFSQNQTSTVTEHDMIIEKKLQQKMQ